MLLEHLGELLTHELHDLVLVGEGDLFLCRMNVDIDLARINLQGEVDERMRAFCEEGTVEAFERSFQGRAVDVSVCSGEDDALECCWTRKWRKPDSRLMKNRNVPFLAWKLGPLHHALTLTESSASSTFSSTNSRLTASP
jgi:hypothetical protein